MMRIAISHVMIAAALAAATPACAASPVQDAIRARLAGAGATPGVPGGAASAAGLRAFYAARDYRPAWVGDGTAGGGRARAALAVLRGADRHGLRPGDYDATEIESRAMPRTARDRARLDVLISAALAEYGGDLHLGRVAPDGIDGGVGARRRGFDAVALLAGAVRARDLGGYFDRLAPRSPEYRRLLGALAAYRRIAAAGGWPAVADGGALRPRALDRRVGALRRRLAASGDLSGRRAGGDLYGAALEGAVRRFQARHGLAVDGIVGPRTLAALNRTAESRIGQIRLNLERRRWMAADPGRRYVFVNTADFALKLVEDGKTVLDMRVVVGTPYRRTPVFSAAMTYLEFNPYWNIPPRIAREEIAARARRDPAWFAEQGIRVFAPAEGSARPVAAESVDWSAAAGLPYRLRQDPGPFNPLGRIKFMFPNAYDVYLHDTPSRGLFDRTVRTFSHGCIRIEKPVALALRLLAPEGGWSAAAVRREMDAGTTRVVRLARPVPVHIAYLTAWVNRDGTVNFRADIYGRDARLAAALERSSVAAAD